MASNSADSGRTISIGVCSSELEDNAVSSRRFSWLTFLPFTLILQFRNYANVYQLMVVSLMLIPGVSPLTLVSSLGPLLFVLFVSELREFYEEFSAWKRDTLTNNAKCNRLLLNDEGKGERWSKWKQDRDLFRKTVSWWELKPGHLVLVNEGDEVPADLVIIASSHVTGVVMVETSKLDGETNLKRRQTVEEISDFYNLPLQAEPPHPDMYRFRGALDGSLPLSITNLLLRNTRVKNTEWVVGVVVYAGTETKAELNARAQRISGIAGASKSTKLQKLMDKSVVILFAFQLLASLLVTAGNHLMHTSTPWYLDRSGFKAYKPKPATSAAAGTRIGEVVEVVEELAHKLVAPVPISKGDALEGRGLLLEFFTNIILLSTFIPAAMWVACEVIRIFQALGIELKGSIKCNAKNIHDDAGQLTHVFSDKTGTLTANEMQVVAVFVDGKFVEEVIEQQELLTDEAGSPKESLTPLKPARFDGVTPSHPSLIQSVLTQIPSAISGEISNQWLFFRVLSLCHTCERKRAPSPDEGALVGFAADLGIDFLPDETGKVVTLSPSETAPKILRVLEYSSDRKMMSVVAEINREVYLLTKGADSAVIPRCSGSSDLEISSLRSAVSVFASRGLRTLVIAARKITDWPKVSSRLAAAEVAEANGDFGIVSGVETELETRLTVLGCTAVKDALQPFVHETLEAFKNADIKISMITGDKRETAVGVAQSCGLIASKADVKVMIPSPVGLGDAVFVPLSAFGNQNNQLTRQHSARGTLLGNLAADDIEKFKNSQDDGPYSIVIDGATLALLALSQGAGKQLVDKVNHPLCEAAIFCRVSPKQKGEIVETFRKHSHPNNRIMAIGDGGNDINMLRISDVGVGIAGREGSQAANAADFAIKSFGDVYKLVFRHGRTSSFRMSNFVHVFSYKNVAFTLLMLYFAPYSAYSGRSIFEGWYILLFNSCFGAVPFLIASLTDEDLRIDKRSYSASFPEMKQSEWDAQILPRVYKEAKNQFNVISFAKWYGYAIAHSVIIFGGATLFRSEIAGKTGKPMDNGTYSIQMYTIIIFVVSLMTVVYSGELTLSFMASIFLFNFVTYFVFVYAYDWANRSTVDPMSYSTNEILRNQSFWIMILLLTILCLLPNMIGKTRKLFGFKTLNIVDKLNIIRTQGITLEPQYLP